MGRDVQGSELLAGIPMRRVGRADFEDYAPLRAMGLSAFYVE
jgi:hypothetical protein